MSEKTEEITLESLSKQINSLNLVLSNLIADFNNFKITTEPKLSMIIRDQAYMANRIDALEHPRLDAALKSFQLLRQVVAEENKDTQ